MVDIYGSFKSPLVFLHIYASIFFKGYSFLFKQEALLFLPSKSIRWRHLPFSVYHPVTGYIHFLWGLAHNITNNPGSFRPSGHPGNLPIGCYLSRRNIPDYFIYFFIKIIIFNTFSLPCIIFSKKQSSLLYPLYYNLLSS